MKKEPFKDTPKRVPVLEVDAKFPKGVFRKRADAQTLWQPPQTAPKNQLILANTGYPWPVLAHWCEVSGKWATSILNEDLAAGDKIDVWFETEYEDEKALIGWMSLPAFPNRPKTGQTQEAKK